MPSKSTLAFVKCFHLTSSIHFSLVCIKQEYSDQEPPPHPIDFITHVADSKSRADTGRGPEVQPGRLKVEAGAALLQPTTSGEGLLDTPSKRKRRPPQALGEQQLH